MGKFPKVIVVALANRDNGSDVIDRISHEIRVSKPCRQNIYSNDKGVFTKPIDQPATGRALSLFAHYFQDV